MSLEQPPPARRASDNDRERAASLVQEAHGDGRLDFQELDERLTQVYAAKTEVELRAATADLVPAEPAGAAEAVIRVKHSSQVRQGAWRVPERVVALAEHSSVKLDFTDALVRRPEVRVDASLKHSSITIVVPAGWVVNLDEVDLVGSSSANKTGAGAPDGVRLVVSGQAKYSSVVVRHPRKRRWWWPWYSK
ncbi:protein of unknown function DUF1707 [Kribbella flavida DSM 17836]|uniref:DUF1707 domain-containing protein n=1 Tax=Kribbella flavida (strain DSM 17836 / JCM 10339 / NBRC 14399) TaxID=479435 RepID=D2Q1T7_KRIFD|nr:DUF1707 domain-containing protein [Kribbella flavida]ADB32076.1 protein of unknown function DUF1707 [Kribbella flavida DSM 17836]